MNAPANFVLPRVMRLRLGVLALALAADPRALRAAEAADAGPKPYVLFMGMDLQVEVKQQLRAVKAVSGDSFIVQVDNKPVTVSMSQGLIAMSAKPQLKLTDKVATVAELKVERAYTPEADPSRKMVRQQAANIGLTQENVSATQLAGAMRAAAPAPTPPTNLPGAGGGTTTTTTNDAGAKELADASRAFENSSLSAGADFHGAGFAGGRQADAEGGEGYDAVEVTCKVSAPHRMLDPYIILVTNYREPGQTGAEKLWIYAKALERLDETPLTVRLLEGGFPPGFQMGKTQFHIYGSGLELGSNVSERNLTLTRDEAHQYIVIDHLATHKGATLAPSVALGAHASELRTSLSAETLQQACYVKVSADGQPQGAFRNEGCTTRFNDPAVEAAVAATRFKPALNAGKAVAGVAKLKVSDLAN